MKKFFVAAFATMFAFAFGSCSELEDLMNEANENNGENTENLDGLTIGTPTVSDITENTAVFTCTLNVDESVIPNPQQYFATAQAGFCYCPASQGTPTVNGTKIDALQSAYATQGRSMTTTVTQLTPGVRYNVRAYVTMDGKTYYSGQKAFTTLTDNGGDLPDLNGSLVGTTWVWDTTAVDAGHRASVSMLLGFTTATRGYIEATSYYVFNLPYYDTSWTDNDRGEFTYTFDGTGGVMTPVGADEDSDPATFTLTDQRHITVVEEGWEYTEDNNGNVLDSVYVRRPIVFTRRSK